MAILAPADLPVVLKVTSDPLKKFVLTKLGGSVVDVEITEDQFETILRTTGDFICGYFPREQRMSVFWTNPMQPTYPLPEDAYWVQSVDWNPALTMGSDIFGAESYMFNIGTLIGTQNMLLDYHLLQSYRKFSQKVLGTEGHWEVIGEGIGDATRQKIRLYPTPKGAFPVVVLYIPVVTHFRSPQAKQICSEMLLAEAKQIVGSARRKVAGMPTPDGGSITFDGGDLVQEGIKERDELTEKAIKYGEPLSIYMW